MTGRINYTREAQQQPNELDDWITKETKRTLIAYEVDEPSGELVVDILGVFHGGQDWEGALGGDQDDPEWGR